LLVRCFLAHLAFFVRAVRRQRRNKRLSVLPEMEILAVTKNSDNKISQRSSGLSPQSKHAPLFFRSFQTSRKSSRESRLEAQQLPQHVCQHRSHDLDLLGLLPRLHQHSPNISSHSLSNEGTLFRLLQSAGVSTSWFSRRQSASPEFALASGLLWLVSSPGLLSQPSGIAAVLQEGYLITHKGMLLLSATLQFKPNPSNRPRAFSLQIHCASLSGL
jgi:hypothetical protein